MNPPNHTTVCDCVHVRDLFIWLFVCIYYLFVRIYFFDCWWSQLPCPRVWCSRLSAPCSCLVLALPSCSCLILVIDVCSCACSVLVTDMDGITNCNTVMYNTYYQYCKLTVTYMYSNNNHTTVCDCVHDVRDNRNS